MNEQSRRVYLAGPMSGYAAHNFPLFNSVAHKLRVMGYEVFNPAENVGGDTSLPRSFYMRIDIPALLNCDEVVLLPGWRRSRGANLETWLALDLGMPIYEYKEIAQTVSLHPLTDVDVTLLPFDQRYSPASDQLAYGVDDVLDAETARGDGQ